MASSEQLNPPTRPTFIRRVLERYRWMSLWNKIGLWGLLAALAIGAISLQWIQPAYRTAKMWLFLNMADKAIERKDYNSASLAFRKALLSGMDNPASWKALAKFLDQMGSPEVINVWERLAKMEPAVAQYRYNQAEAALKFARVYEAEEVFRGMSKALQGTPEGLRIEAEIAIAKKQDQAAEKALSRLLELKPGDQRASFDLTSLKVSSSDPGVRMEARAQLEQIAAGESAFTSAALRKLVSLAADEKDFNEADRLAGRLAGRPDATIQDRLTFAQLEAMSNSFTLAITLQNLRVYANNHPESFDAIMRCLLSSGLDSAGTARWVEELPPATRAQPEVESALFSYYLATADWDHVFELLKNPKSPLHLPQNVFDLANAAFEQDRAGDTSADKTWQEAVYAAEGHPKPLQILSLLASARGWTSATGRALSALADSAPGEASVWWLLVQHEKGVRNLPGLYKALQGLMRINPYDINVASNWVLAGALVRQGDTSELLKIAERTYYSTDPSDGQAATAYAIALLQVNHPEEAMRIIDKMSISDRRNPARAVYVGAVLAANGRKAEALEYFDRSAQISDSLFSEEKALRAIWRGVANGEATTAEEAERLLVQRKDPDIQPQKIEAELANEIQRRSDPAEVQRILSSLKAETESRQKSPVQLEELMRSVRKEPTP